MSAGISDFFHKHHRSRMKSACQQADICLFSESGRFTTVLDMAVKAHKVLGTIGTFTNLGDPSEWEDAEEYRIDNANIMSAVTTLTRAGYSVALCILATESRVPQYHCIAKYIAIKDSDEW